MKKIIAINLASILLLFSCSNDDNQEPSEDFNFNYNSNLLQDGNVSINFTLNSEAHESYTISQTNPDYSCCEYGYLLENNVDVITIDGNEVVTSQIDSNFNITLEDSGDGIYYSSFLITPQQSNVKGKELSIQYRKTAGEIDFVAVIYNIHRERSSQNSIFQYDLYSSTQIDLNYLLNEDEPNETNIKLWHVIDNVQTELTYHGKSSATNILKLYPES